MKYTSIKELNTIKNLLKGVCATVLILTMMASLNIKDAAAQEVTLTPGVDFYSTYVFRGVAFSGPSIQPYVEFEAGNFTFGGWGSQGYDGFQEMDLYASYSFDFGLSIGLTDYYYPGSEYFDGESHAFEINTGIEISNFSLAANMVLNEASGAGSAGEDLYFEAGLTVGSADLFVGAGDGWHSSDGEFNLVNVGIGTSKEIKLTEYFSLPLSGALILNPDSEQFYIVVGVSF
ncbi:MAG: TorF family putative porin [Balneolaceae bacterium]